MFTISAVCRPGLLYRPQAHERLHGPSPDSDPGQAAREHAERVKAHKRRVAHDEPLTKAERQEYEEARKRGRREANRVGLLRLAHLLADGPVHSAQLCGRAGLANGGLWRWLRPCGWFVRVKRGVYALTPTGRQALASGGRDADH